MIETIWTYLKSKGFQVKPRDAKKVVHLALESENLNGAQKKRMPVRYDVTEKLDGVYSLVTVISQGGGVLEVRHWGRSGKALSNCGVLDEHLDATLRRVRPPIILISEITSDDPLAKLSGYLTPSRVNDSKFKPTNFQDNFHDILSVKEFIEGKSEMTFHFRQHNLNWVLQGTPLSYLKGDYLTFEEASKKAKEETFPAGKEGLICRDIHSLWSAGARNETMIKIKEKLSFDCTVIGMVSGKEGSKYEHTLGKLVVAFRAFGEADGKLLEVPISGMTDAQRNLWWSHEEPIVGKVVKVDAKSFTETGNLREPRFKEIRHDKPSDFPVKLLEATEEHPIVVTRKAKATWELHPYCLEGIKECLGKMIS